MATHLKNALVFFILALAYNAKAQPSATPAEAPSQKLTTALDKYYKRYPQEKLFVHTAQNRYTNGQKMWFKVYAMAYGKPSTLSNIVYVNLTDRNGKVLGQNKLLLTDGTAGGEIDVPDSLISGWYQVQAYTAWMLNFDRNEICRQKIYIKNIRDRAEATHVANAGTYHINFFPEGGDLLNGYNSKIAFKAVDADGGPVQVVGDLLINGKPSGVKLVSRHDGMGTFRLEAYTKDIYTVVVHYPGGIEETVPLPSVKQTGLNLSVTDDGGYLAVGVAMSANSPKDATIIAMQGNGISTEYPLKLARGTNVVRFKKSEFTTGIVRFTVFDDNTAPVAERIVFVNNHDQLRIAAGEDSVSKASKGRNMISLNVKNGEGRPFKGTLSISVTDGDMDGNPDANIMSALLVSSEIKGFVNNPAYYFQNSSDSLQQQLDLVMLTSGWRHFKWEKVLNDNPIALKYQPEHFQFAVGQIDDFQPKKQLRLKLIVVDPDSTKHFVNVLPDSAGRFVIDDNKLRGKARIFYDAVNTNNNSRDVKLRFKSNVIDSLPALRDSTATNEAANNQMPAAFLDTLAKQQAAKAMEKNILLREVTVKSSRRRPLDVVVADHVRNLTPDRVFDLDLVNEPSLPPGDVFNYIQGRFPGLEVYTQNGLMVFRYRGANTFMESVSPEEPNVINSPYFYLDESRVHSDDVLHMSMYNIALVRFVPPPAWFAPLNGGLTGAILIYTRNSKDANIDNNPRMGFSSYTIEGYTAVREFAQPDYTNPKLAQQADYRTTLYWNPGLKPDGDGNVKIRFNNSDRARHYRVTMQGMDKDGNLGYYSKIY